MRHNLYIGEPEHESESGPSDPASWDYGLTTNDLIKRLTNQVQAEDDGDRLTIIVTTERE